MAFSISSRRFFTKVFLLVLTVTLLTNCSDMFLKSKNHKPNGLDIEPNQVDVFVGNSVDFDITLTDKSGNKFKKIPGWIDTLFTFPKGKISLDEVNTSFTTNKPGDLEVEVTLAGISENISIVARPRAGMIQSTQCVDCAIERINILPGKGGAIRLFLKDNEKNISNDISLVVYQNGQSVDEIFYSSQSLISSPTSDPDITVFYLPIPGDLVQPGLSVLVKIGSSLTYPKNGKPVPINVRQVPKFNIQLIPIRVAANGKTGHVNKSNKNKYIEKLLDIFPVSEYTAEIHPTVTVSIPPSTEGFYGEVLKVVQQVWVQEGKPDYYYYGVIPEPESQGGGFYTLGVGYIGGRQAVGWDNNYTIFPGKRATAAGTLAHELGHNFGRPHTACEGEEGTDPNYPYLNGSIGVFGYEADKKQLKSPQKYKDIMSYCYPQWVSDYTYSKVLQYRLNSSGQFDSNQQAQDVLLVSGSLNNGQITLDPAFRVSAPSVLPENSGPYTLAGYDKKGNKLFTISFSGTKIDHSDVRNFVFAIPVERVEINKLKTLRLTGKSLTAMQQSNVPAKKYQANSKMLPDVTVRRRGMNTVSLNWSGTGYKKVMIKNARTGEIIGYVNEGFTELKTNANKLKLFFSDGVHTTTKTVLVR